MNKNVFKALKNWFKFAKPKKWVILYMWIMGVLAYSTFLIAPVFAAKVITALTELNWQNAYIYLSLGIGVLLLRNFFWYFNFKQMKKLFGGMYLTLQGRIASSVFISKNKSLKKMSTERIMNTFHSDIYDISVTGDGFCTFGAKIARAIGTIIAIGVIDWKMMLICIVVCICNFFILDTFNRRRAKVNRKSREVVDQLAATIREVVDSKEQINELGVQKVFSEKIGIVGSKYVSLYGKDSMWSYNILHANNSIYSFIVFLITCILIFSVSQGSLGLESYLVIVPYLTAAIEVVNDAMNFMQVIRKADVAIARVKTVLELPPIEYKNGDDKQKDIFGTIEFLNVSYRGDKHGNPKLKRLSFSVRENETTLFLGPQGCGKRTIFHLLRREIKETNGEVLIGGISSHNYNLMSYQDNIAFLSTKPIMFKGSIMRNLTIVSSSQKKIMKVCQLLEIDEYFKSLPKGYQAEASALPQHMKYLLALARTLLLDTEIVALYELPTNFSDDNNAVIDRALARLKGKRTVLLFSMQERISHLADKVIEIAEGEIKNISFTEMT